MIQKRQQQQQQKRKICDPVLCICRSLHSHAHVLFRKGNQQQRKRIYLSRLRSNDIKVKRQDHIYFMWRGEDVCSSLDGSMCVYKTKNYSRIHKRTQTLCFRRYYQTISLYLMCVLCTCYVLLYKDASPAIIIIIKRKTFTLD